MAVIKKTFAIILIVLVSFTLISCGEEASKDANPTETAQPSQSVIPSAGEAEKVEETPIPQSFEPELFVQIDNVKGFIHGIVFDDKGNMYIGKDGLTVLKITPDKKVSTFATYDGELVPRTHIWNMAIGGDGNIYAAAGSRVIRISKEGAMESVLTDGYSGNYGMLDIKFDLQGNMYVIKDRMVIQYTPELQKTVFIDETANEAGFKEGTGICFDEDYKNLYVTDPATHSVYKYPIDADGKAGDPQVIKDVYPHYIEAGNDGNIYGSMETPGFYKMDAKGEFEVLSKTVQFATIKIGSGPFGEDYIYATEFNKVYRVKIGSSGR